jgi:hypothetical protein
MLRWAVGGAALLLSMSGVAHADTCPVPEGGSAKLAAMDARDRIAFLEGTFHDQARYARTWKWAWFGIGLTTLAASAAQAVGWAVFTDSSNPKREPNIIDNSIVAGFSVVGPFASLLLSLGVEKDAPVVDQLLRDTGGGAAGTCLVLARMEELLVKDGKEERFNTAWFQHVLAVVGVGALFAILGVEAATSSDPVAQQEHWMNAITNSIAGLLLTEGQILTSPTGAVSNYERYLKGGGVPERKKLAFSLAPNFKEPGLSFRVTF